MPIKQSIVTPGQGLLLLIKHYQDDPIKLKVLKTLYINGANHAQRCIELCSALLDEPLMQDYEIALDEVSINTDPSRRYFETHLAYQSLKHQLKYISHAELQGLYFASWELLHANIPNDKLQTIISVLNGKLTKPVFKKRENYQFHFYIKRIIEGTIFTEFSDSDRQKVLTIERILYLALVNGWCATEMPLDIYHSEQFSTRARGRIMRDMEEVRKMRNQHFGLLKGYMPLALADIARADVSYEHIKSGDYATFDDDSPVVQACFQQLVHPFSNSISGSFLVFLRMMGLLHQREQSLDFTRTCEKFMMLLRMCMSSSLFYSGGHSLYEYVAILHAPEVQEFFEFLPGFAALDLGQLFFEKNEVAFDEALQATLEYQDRLFIKDSLHEELFGFFKAKDKEKQVSVQFEFNAFT